MTTRHLTMMAAAALALALTAGCGGAGDEGGSGGSGARNGGGGAPGGGPWGSDQETAAVPVEVAAVTRQSVASYIQTNGTLEAENDVEIVARTQGPIVELLTEEGRRVQKGQVMARVDPKEARAQVKIAEVALREAERIYERAKETFEEQLISQAEYDAALTAKEAAEATLFDRQVQLDYTEVRAPFSAVVANRIVKLGDNVTVGEVLFRISDFDPLLCKIQVPEKELPRLRKGQPAYLTVEAWPEERFEAEVLRLSPVVDAATGTIRVTLKVDGRDRLRPGMFASVFLETDRHENALTIPKSALSLESLGDTVYVIHDDVAARRPVELGYEEADIVEVASGLQENDRVIVVGQDGLSDGTPIRILEGPGAEEAVPLRQAGGEPAENGPPRRADASGPPGAVDQASPSRERGSRPGGRSGPPPQMVEACEQKKEGAPCSFTSSRSGSEVGGTCRPRRDDPKALVCRPEGDRGGPPVSGPPGSDGGGR
jgi:membrane fusion protein (multidrug efflux system)